MDPRRLALVPAALLLASCASPEADDPETAAEVPAAPTVSPTSAEPAPEATAEDGRPFEVREVASLDQPWAMTFLPDGRALVTLKEGDLLVVDPESGESAEIDGTPEVADAGQGGMHDVILGPTYEEDGTIYLSWSAEADDGAQGIVARATLDLDGATLTDVEPLWEQDPASGNGHYALRLAVSPDEEHLFVTSGDRQELDPAQDIQSNLGKILRLTLDGEPAPGNPFEDQHDTAAQIWSYGHRNPLGIGFDAEGNLWSSEMGPAGGDELNLIEPGANYGWPEVSEGEHYDGTAIPEHATNEQMVPPVSSWVPAISPGNLLIYTGEAFPQWTGDAFLGGLSGQSLNRVDLDGTTGEKADEWDMDERIREVDQAPDGTIWLLEDGSDATLLQLTPPTADQ